MKTTNEVLQELAARCQRLRREDGDRLPSERELAIELSASRSTVRRALNILVEKGVITVVRGRRGGAYLAGIEETGRVSMIIDGRRVNRRLIKIASFSQMLLEGGFEVGTRVLALELETPDARIALQLEMQPNEPAVSLLRLRFADGAPLSLEHMYLSYRRLPTLVDEGLGGATSVYAVLRERYGISIAKAEEEVEIIAANPQEARLLAVEPGAALLTIRRLAHDLEGRPVECSYDLFRGDRARRTVLTLDPIDNPSRGPYTSTDEEPGAHSAVAEERSRVG